MTDIEKVRRSAEVESRCDINGIWVYGNDAQGKLADFSRTIASTIAIRSDLNSQLVIDNVIEKLEGSVLADDKGGIFSRKRSGHKYYKDLISCIDQMVVELRLRQAQLLKDISVFEQMSLLIDECIRDLEIYVEEGEKRLDLVEQRSSDEEQLDWIDRMRRKISELTTSHIIAMQSKAQVELLIHNDQALAEKIAAAVNNTIPLWRNQAVITYGLETYKTSDEQYNSVIRLSTQSVKKGSKEAGKLIKRIKHNTIDEEGIIALHTRLEKTLDEIKALEINVDESRDGLSNIVLKTDHDDNS